MTRILQLALILAALAAAFACTEVGFLAIQARRTVSTLNSDASTLETSLNRLNGTLNAVNSALSDPENGLQANLADLHRTLLVAGGAITNIEKGTRTWQKKQNAIADQALTDERSLNIALLSLSTTANSISGLTGEQKSSLSNLENTASASFMQMGALSNTVEKQLTPVLASFAQASANAADTTASMDASAHDVQAFIHRETTPVRGTWNVIKSFLREFAGPAAQVATATK